MFRVILNRGAESEVPGRGARRWAGHSVRGCGGCTGDALGRSRLPTETKPQTRKNRVFTSKCASAPRCPKRYWESAERGRVSVRVRALPKYLLIGAVGSGQCNIWLWEWKATQGRAALSPPPLPEPPAVRCRVRSTSCFPRTWADRRPCGQEAASI